MDIQVKVKMVIMSHLSDVQDAPQNTGRNHIRINFVKYLILKFKDTDTLIDANEQYQLFLKQNAERLGN